MDNDLDAPSWWNRLYPDYAAFEDAMEAILPPVVPIGPVPLPRDVVLLGAWFTPGGQSGLYTRLALWASETGRSLSELAMLWATVLDQAGAAGFGDGPGVGGGFGWKAEKLMPQLIIPGAFRVAIEGSSGGQDVTNVVGVINGAGTALGAAQAVQAAWKVTSGPHVRLSSLYTLKGFRALELGSANGGIAFIADSTAGGVTTSNGLATNAACALIKWNGGTRSRSSRGRMYYGPLMDAQIAPDGRTLDTVPRNTISAAFDAFRASLSASGYSLAVLSPTLSQAFPVTSSTVEAIVATQRRRIRG